MNYYNYFNYQTIKLINSIINRFKVVFILITKIIMKEQLIDKIDTDKNQDNVNIRNINYSMFFLLILASGYSFLFITMAMNTSSMNNNLNKIIDVMNRKIGRAHV